MRNGVHEHIVEQEIVLEAVPVICAEILACVREHSFAGACVIALSGPLGAGKTTFSQAFARTLGVTQTVQSPTFVIEKRYATSDQNFTKLVHIDAYRLEDPHELEVLGFSQTKKDQHTLILVEWAERIETMLPLETFWIWLEHREGDTRHMRYGWKKIPAEI